MKRKYEEELIKLAFGDCEPNDSTRAKRLLDEDADAAKLFSSYADLREGLKQLKTPEHQLSSERLRARILEGGLKKSPSPGLSWRWTFAPVAVAAVALVVTLRLGGGSSLPGGPVLSADASFEKINGTSKSPIDWKANETRVPTVARNSVTAEPERTVTAQNPTTVAANTPVKATLAVQNLPPASKPAAKGMTPQELSSLALDGALPAGAVALHQDPSDGDPIVLIGADSDEATGVNRATEVSSPSNVVVGG